MFLVVDREHGIRWCSIRNVGISGWFFHKPSKLCIGALNLTKSRLAWRFSKGGSTLNFSELCRSLVCREYSVVKYSTRGWLLAYGYTRYFGRQFEKAQTSSWLVSGGAGASCRDRPNIYQLSRAERLCGGNRRRRAASSRPGCGGCRPAGTSNDVKEKALACRLTPLAACTSGVKIFWRSWFGRRKRERAPPDLFGRGLAARLNRRSSAAATTARCSLRHPRRRTGWRRWAP